jgi:hypothetical protein
VSSVDDIMFHVRPAGQGWLVDSGGGVERLHFFSGAKAEAQAHALARCVSSVGHDARVLIHDRAEQIIGSTRYFARDPGEETAA